MQFIIIIKNKVGTHEANSEWLYGPDGLASIDEAAEAAEAASGETPREAGGCWCWLLLLCCTGSAKSGFGSPSIFFRLSEASATERYITYNIISAFVEPLRDYTSWSRSRAHASYIITSQERYY